MTSVHCNTCGEWLIHQFDIMGHHYDGHELVEVEEDVEDSQEGKVTK